MWSCRLKGFTKTVLGNCWPNKAEMAVHGNTSLVKNKTECAVTVKKKVRLAAMDDDNAENHVLFVAQITLCEKIGQLVFFFSGVPKSPLFFVGKPSTWHYLYRRFENSRLLPSKFL